MSVVERPSGLLVEQHGWKQNRITEQTIRADLPASSVPSKFKDYSSYLMAAVTIPWVNACMSVCAYNFASNPWSMIDTDEEPIDDESDPFVQLMARPNPGMSGFSYLETAYSHLKLTGNCYITLEERDGYGRPRTIYLANPARMRIIPAPDGIKGYVYDASGSMAGGMTYGGFGSGALIPYQPEEVIHIRLPHPNDDYYGLGNVEPMTKLLDTVMAMSDHELGYWQSGGRIVGTLQTDRQLQDEEFDDLVQRWQRASRDKNQRVRTAILENGLKYQAIGEGLQGLDLVDIDKGKRDQILAMWGVPAAKLGLLENAQYKLEDADRTFWTETLAPDFLRWEDGIQPLVDLFHDDGRSMRFDRKNFEDDTVKLANAKAMVDSGQYTIDEARIYAGAEPLPNGAGEVLMLATTFTPVRLSDLDELAGETVAPPTPPAPTPPTQPSTVAPEPDEPPDNVVSLADHVPGMKAVERAQLIRDEQLRAMREAAVRSMKARQRVAVGPMARLQRHGKRIGAHGGLPARQGNRGSQRHPAVGAAIERERDRLLKTLVPETVPKLREAFRDQQKKITRPAVLNRLVKAENVRQALREAWPADVLRSALVPLYETAAQAGYSMGQRVLPPKRGKAVSAAVAAQFPAIGDKVNQRWQGIDDTTMTAIADQVEEGVRRGYSVLQIANGYDDEGYDGIAGVFAQATDWRAEQIARTETMLIHNESSLAAYTDAGIEQVELLDGDYDEVCAARDGTVVSVDDVPDEHVNGSLALVPVIPDTSTDPNASAADAGDDGGDGE